MTAPQTAANKVGRRLPGQLRPVVRRALVRYRHRGLTASDVMLAAYPKSGSTWLRFVLAGALSGQDMNFDVIRAVSPPVGEHRRGPLIVNGSGHLIKSHELPAFVPPRSRRPNVIYLVRDGRDIAISYFHHLRRQGQVSDDFEGFFPRFLDGSLVPYGSWQHHVRRWLDYSSDAPAPVLIVRYEDMLERPVETLKQINESCDLGLDESRLVAALEANTPDAMRKKESASRVLEASTTTTDTQFVRAARSGSWRQELSTQLCAEFELLAGRELLDLGYPLSDPSHGRA